MIQHSTIRLSLTLGFAIALGQAAFAQPAERPPRGGERPDREALRKQILERFDKNKDGKIFYSGPLKDSDPKNKNNAHNPN